MAGFTTTAHALAQRYRRRASAVRQEQQREAAIIAAGVSAESHRQQQRLIYSVPIPTGPTGRPLWRRSGLLRLQEHARVVNGVDVILTNDRPYAERRHEQTTFRYMHPAPWRTVTLTVKRRWIHERRRAAVQRTLSRS